MSKQSAVKKETDTARDATLTEFNALLAKALAYERKQAALVYLSMVEDEILKSEALFSDAQQEHLMMIIGMLSRRAELEEKSIVLLKKERFDKKE